MSYFCVGKKKVHHKKWRNMVIHSNLQLAYAVNMNCISLFLIKSPGGDAAKFVPSGLSLRAGGWRFFPATVNMISGYCHRKIAGK